MSDEELQITELLARQAEAINVIEDKWIVEWAALAERYFKLEDNEAVRIKVVDATRLLFNKYHLIYEEELMNKIILPYFNYVDQECSSSLRRSLIHLLNDLGANCVSDKHCNAATAILRKMLTRPFRQNSELSNRELVDSRTIVTNLNRLFKKKLYRLPIDPAVKILDILISYLNLTLKHPIQGPAPAELTLIRKEIFSLLLNLRCNKHGHLGVADQMRYSPFILCYNNNNQLKNNILSIESRCVNLDSIFVAIIACLNQEGGETLDAILKGLPSLLANKPLVTTAGNERINQLCVALSNLIIVDRKSDYLKHVLQSLTSLLIYKSLLDNKSIKTMLSVFEDSIRSVRRHPIVPHFTTCLIELQTSSEMAKFVPIVLNHLTRFSPTVTLGPSVLEFLSYLILFPKLHENFSQDEYKFIFSIALPYTNPFRFTDYITCLAFRVIAMWYLNCRPALRCAFVEQVKKSLQSNVIQPFKDNIVPSPMPALHSQTSSPIVSQTPPITYSCPASMSPADQRKRSSSFNAENCYRNQQGVLTSQNHQSSLQLNEELMETFADLLSRYAHGQYLAIAPKNRLTEMLIDRSTSQTWLHGNSLITITAGKSNNGWAEILVRRPTGNTSWVGRLQNTVGVLPMFNQQVYTSPLNFGNDIMSLFSSLSITTDDGSQVGANGGTVIEPPPSETMSAISSAFSSIASTISGSYNSNPNTSSPPSRHTCSTRDPIPLPKDKKFDIALSNFDLITPYETHKVGVIYVACNQVDNRPAILSNQFGSPRYYEFLSQVGNCIILEDIDPEIFFIGGLDVKGEDGKYAYFWKDNITQVIFHVATFMPGRENDPQCNNKNRHIGNDHVCIVFNDSGEQFKLSTIKGTGQFIKACVIINPLDDDTNTVDVEVLPDLRAIVGEIEPRHHSNLGAALYARQMAVHLNLASKIFERHQCEGFFSKEPYVSNWVERLRCIKRIRQRLEESRRANLNHGSLTTRGSNTLR